MQRDFKFLFCMRTQTYRIILNSSHGVCIAHNCYRLILLLYVVKSIAVIKFFYQSVIDCISVVTLIHQ